MKLKGLAITPRYALVANFSLNTTVYASGAVTDSIMSKYARRGLITPCGGFIMCR